jgi:hypothetical protein
MDTGVFNIEFRFFFKFYLFIIFFAGSFTAPEV